MNDYQHPNTQPHKIYRILELICEIQFSKTVKQKTKNWDIRIHEFQSTKTEVRAMRAKCVLFSFYIYKSSDGGKVHGP